MPKSSEDVKQMQEKDAKLRELEDKCKKLVRECERVFPQCSKHSHRGFGPNTQECKNSAFKYWAEVTLQPS